MSAPDRRAKVERPGKELSVRRQCALVGVARSGVYRSKPVTGADDLAVMRRIDELHLELPFYGSRRMTFELNKEGGGVNRKRVQRLMRVMGIEALVPRPGTSKAAPGHKIYPYLLRGGAGGGAASVRKAADFQYRSGLHFHRRGFRRQARGGRRRDFDGRTRP